MARDFQTAGESAFELALEDPDAFFDQIALFELAKDLPPDRVRMSQYWLLRDDQILGSSRLRHQLIPVLELDGGNIGYEIRPSARCKGFGSALLRLTLQEARGIGLSRVLLTTEPTNLGSIGVIQCNGGVFADTSVSPRTGCEMHRYWIEL
jgi:predicted acetyltransferase